MSSSGEQASQSVQEPRFLDLELSEEEILFQDTARQFARDYLEPAAAALDRDEEFPSEHWKRLAELGFLSFLVPPEYGGSGLGNRALSLVLEEVNRACASTGVSLSVHNSLVNGAVVRFGTEEQKAKYLPRTSRGELIGAYALTEPDHGSDVGAIETRAERRGDRYVLNGVKSWITNGISAGLVVVFATLDRSLGAKGITAFLVETAWSGFSVGKKEKKLGIRGSETAQLRFDDLEVPVENRLGDEGQGFSVAMDTLDGGRIGIASQAAGLVAASLDASIRYARDRKQFGRPIAEFQPIRRKIADMAVDLDSSRLLVRRAAGLRDAGRPHTREASVAKLFSSEAAARATREAVQIHGGAGYCKEFPVERFYRDAKVTEIYEGTSEIQRLVISRKLLEDA